MAELDVREKPCPRCQRPIAKTLGCAHMTCNSKERGGCLHEFWWCCLQDFHGLPHYYKCKNSA